MFYCVDKVTGKRTSLKTTNKDEAQQIVDAKNNSLRQPVLNLQIAKAYLAGTDNGIATRTWRQALDSLTSPAKRRLVARRCGDGALGKSFTPPSSPRPATRRFRLAAFLFCQCWFSAHS
jgi:hypothetical protein